MDPARELVSRTVRYVDSSLNSVWITQFGADPTDPGAGRPDSNASARAHPTTRYSALPRGGPVRQSFLDGLGKWSQEGWLPEPAEGSGASPFPNRLVNAPQQGSILLVAGEESAPNLGIFRPKSIALRHFPPNPPTITNRHQPPATPEVRVKSATSQPGLLAQPAPKPPKTRHPAFAPCFRPLLSPPHQNHPKPDTLL